MTSGEDGACVAITRRGLRGTTGGWHHGGDEVDFPVEQKWHREDGAADVPVHIEEGSVYREILKLAHKDGFDMIVMASAKGDFPNYEIEPNLARVVRNAHCTVAVHCDGCSRLNQPKKEQL